MRAAVAWLLVCGAVSVEVRAEGADGRFERRESPHFVLHQDVDLDRASGWHGSVRFERDVLATLESAYDALDTRLGLRPERKIAVWIQDPAWFDARFAGLFPFGVAGFYGRTIQVRGDVAVTTTLSRTLHHELVHAALDARAPSLVAPAWWNEGLAEWFESRAHGARRLTAGQWARLAAVSRDGGWLSIAQLSGPNLAGVPPARAADAYLISRALVDLLARRSGDASLARTLDVWVRTRDLERALQRVHRLSSVELEAALRAELAGR